MAGRLRLAAGRATIAVATVSLVVTGSVAAGGGVKAGSVVGVYTLVEDVGMLVLAMISTRYLVTRQAMLNTVVVATAVGLSVLRFGSEGDLGGTLTGIFAWALVAVLTAAAGRHLRSLDERRVRLVIESQRAQRLQLARDLHDYVAHDISEMLAMAHAGQVLAVDDVQLATVLEKIGEAGQRAMSSMDQTVQMLHTVAGPSEERSEPENGHPTLDDLAGLTERFAATRQAPVRLSVDPPVTQSQLAGLPYELSATLYRVAVEGLTNVRRHAPAGAEVEVALRRIDGPTPIERRLELSIIDTAPAGSGPPGSLPSASMQPGSGPSGAPEGRTGGFGLSALAARLRAIGGELAGASDPTGWRLTAWVPWPPTDPDDPVLAGERQSSEP